DDGRLRLPGPPRSRELARLSRAPEEGARVHVHAPLLPVARAHHQAVQALVHGAVLDPVAPEMTAVALDQGLAAESDRVVEGRRGGHSLVRGQAGPGAAERLALRGAR